MVVIIGFIADGAWGMTVQNYAKAAARHRRCASQLASAKEEFEASYLVGLAAECAVKHHLETVNFPAVVQRRKRKKNAVSPVDVMLQHFPKLRTELLAQGEGIIAGRLLVQIGSDKLLQGWTIGMRYTHQPSSPAVIKRFANWAAQTDRLFSEVGL